MTDTTPKLVAINTLLNNLKKTLAITENNKTLETTSFDIVNSLKQIKQPTLKQKQTIYAELYKIHKLKQNTLSSIDYINKLYNQFKHNFKITGGSIEQENDILNEKNKKQSMENFLNYKTYIETLQRDFSI